MMAAQDGGMSPRAPAGASSASPASSRSRPEAISGDRSRLLNALPSHEEARDVRINVLNTSVQGARNAGTTGLLLAVSALISIPQVIAATVIMAMFWNDPELASCSRVKYWTLVQTLHQFFTVIVEWIVYKSMDGSVRNSAVTSWLASPGVKSALNSIKYSLELLGLFWFLVGNMWIISDEEHSSTKAGGHLYNMAFAMITICYIKIFLPCLILVALLPIVCFCLPCLIRLLNRMQDPMRGKGAAAEIIAKLPSAPYVPSMFPDEDASCCICLNEYVRDQTVRVLHCKHHFHQACVDEWLVVNATCPTCRKSIDPNEAPPRQPDDVNLIV
ncbi:hypothetical protein H310_03198 [Aphanomyces invadans]|uniref:RING-type domain-containing protein n=1 Tax=Aphanomyces invadans TaxID=157072 RepID=A0A024UIM6_9STRA|nr:hypothetical protein H310_03198 [Aphanomyces invadans]ETW05433.1 hypothetical protein H310_03198 [Aphanomyces invadans]|eukprot:XP_008865210.1 hypothetical protein H310_03198 [Aphanomyces invadans]